MKVGIDGRFWNESGVGRYVRNLVSQLDKIDNRNNYILFVPKEINPKVNNRNWKIIQTDIPWHSVQEQIAFPKLINQENLDLMHFPYFSIPVFYNKPYVVTIHDLILHHISTGKATTRHPIIYHGKRLGYKFIIRQAVGKSNKIIAVSKATKNEIIDHFKINPEKIIVTYEGIDNAFNGNGEIVQKKITSQYFLHVGNLYPHKNMDLVLKAFSKYKNYEKPPFKIVIAGKEDYFYHRFENMVKEKGLDDNFYFIGSIKDSELCWLYQNALALLSPSLMEGFDLPVIEAMANNCLVLASNIPVHREICKNSAIYFDSQNEDTLILKMKEIFYNKQLFNEKIKSGKSLSLDFSWKKMAEQTIKIYENSLSI